MGYFQTPWHIVLLLLIALLLFGGKRLPEIGRSLGSGMREFKDAVTGHSDAEQPELPPAEPTGGERLPEIGRSLGSGMREFKDAVTGHSDAEQPELPPAEPTASSASPTPSEHETV